MIHGTTIVPSNLITIRAYSLEHKERYNIVIIAKISTFTFYDTSLGTF